MKRSNALLVGLTVFALTVGSGCVYSLRPWFTRDVLASDERLLCKWMYVEDDGSVDDEEVIVVEPTSWGTYRVSELGECALGYIGGKYYFDCDSAELAPTTAWYEGMSSDLEPWEGRCHSLWLITIRKDRVTLRTLDPEKLEKFLRKKDSLRGIAVESTSSVDGEKYLSHYFLIVSETAELQAFLKTHGSADIWTDRSMTYVRAE